MIDRPEYTATPATVVVLIFGIVFLIASIPVGVALLLAAGVLHFYHWSLQDDMRIEAKAREDERRSRALATVFKGL